MNDKKTRAYIGKRSHGCYRIRAPLFSGISPVRLPIKRMWVWIRTSRGLKEKLLAAGWVKFQKLYTPKQVACLVEHLGEP